MMTVTKEISKISDNSSMINNQKVAPREHGTWGMWLVPFFSTLIYLHQATLTTLVYLLIFLAGFMVVAPRISATLRKYLRSIPGEIAVVSILSLAVPVAAISVGHSFDQAFFVFWGYQVLYFVGPIFYVKMKLAGIKFQRIGNPAEKFKLGILNMLYYSALAFALLVAAYFKLIPNTVLIAFAPVIVRAYEGTINLVPTTKLKTVGWGEVLYSLWFGIWIAL